MAFLTLNDLELLSIGLEVAEDVSHFANALVAFSLDDVLNGIRLKRLRYHGPAGEGRSSYDKTTFGLYPFCMPAHSPYLYGLCQEPLRALRQPRYCVVDGRVLAELAEKMPHHRRLQVLAGRLRLKRRVMVHQDSYQ